MEFNKTNQEEPTGLRKLSKGVEEGGLKKGGWF